MTGIVFLSACYEENELPAENQPVDCSKVPDITIENLVPPNPGENDGRIVLTALNGIEYSLNDTLYQDFNEFSNLAKGTYTVYIKNADGCKNDIQINLDEKQVVTWQIPAEGDSVELPFTVYYQTWNWQNIFNEKGVRLYRNDSLVKTQFLNIDTMKFNSMVEGTANWKLALWDAVEQEEISAHQISFTILNPVFELIVNGGSGSGFYREGDVVDIVGTKPLMGLEFLRWSGDSVHLNDFTERITQLTMPAEAIEISAKYWIQDTVSFSSDVEPIFEDNCTTAGCHDPSSLNEDLTDFANIRYYKNEIRDFVATDFMPPPPDMITQQEKEAIISWVNQGALNN
jgi:hypothetical protein